MNCKEKCSKCMSAIADEVTFWIEVFAEYLGWTKSDYHWVFEQHEEDLREHARQNEIKRRRAKYYKEN
ncbi:unnamed protein product [Blepharisma stoltei]|uniref:Uncharacterized protein n=1 Tax=Blepharisma stoltei TaxID=1481888 RepID=A0AAU9KNW8_9CILI|nr:unnamed protein product [Blepharisma stoltei]